MLSVKGIGKSEGRLYVMIQKRLIEIDGECPDRLYYTCF